MPTEPNLFDCKLTEKYGAELSAGVPRQGTTMRIACIAPFANRIALVTGASGGIGGAVARLLAEQGADVALTYGGHADDAEAVARDIESKGRRALTLHADFRDANVVNTVVGQVETRLGPIDILVPAAGAGTSARWDEVSPELWDETMIINLRAPFLLSQRVLPGMTERGYGRILLVSSIAAHTGGMVGPHYAASKAALHGLMHSLAAATAGSGVTVNTIAPALIAGTRMLPSDPNHPVKPPRRTPVGRLGEPEEVADLSVSMLRNGYLSNKVISLDGGLYPT